MRIWRSRKCSFLSHAIKELNKKFLLCENKQEAVQFIEISKQLETHYTVEICINNLQFDLSTH